MAPRRLITVIDDDVSVRRSLRNLLGPDLQQELKRRRRAVPIIFITASPDERVRQPLLKQGAVECLFKPFTETALCEALDAALETRRH